MLRLSFYGCLACLAVCQGITRADSITFAVTDANRFGSFDLSTGAFTPIGGAFGPGYDGLGNLADGSLVGVDGNNNFIRINRTTGAVTTVGPTGITVTTSASLLTGDQFAIDDKNQLYRINPATGAASLVGPTGLPSINLNTFANAFAGNATSLYYIFEQTNPTVVSTLYKIDPATGVATMVGPTGVTELAGAGFADGILYAFGTGTGNHHIETIDLATGLATVGPNYSSAFSIFGTNSGEAVPEPATWLLLGLATVGLLGDAWRRRRQP